MKRMSVFAVVLALVLILGTLSPAAALPGGNWQFGIKLQNLSSANPATIVVDLFKPDGSAGPSISTTTTGAPLVAPPDGSVEVFLPGYSATDVPAGQYSAVVSSSEALGAVVTETDYDYGLADSYNGMAAAPKWFVPYVYHNANSWATEIFVQNTSSAVAHVHVRMSNGTVTQTSDLTLNPNGSGSVDSRPIAALGNNFIGSAVVTSDENAALAVSANVTRLIGTGFVTGNVMVAFRGLTDADAGSKVALPSLYKNFTSGNGLWKSGISVQNTSDVNTGTDSTVNVTFKSDSGGAAMVRTGWVIPKGQSREIYLPDTNPYLDGGGVLPDLFKGSAVVDVTSGPNVVATVIHTNYTAGKGVANGYFGLPQAQGKASVSLPSLYSRWTNDAGWVSGIKLQNIGGTAVTAAVAFKHDADSSDKTDGTRSGITLQPGETTELYLKDVNLFGANQNIAGTWKGSALITTNNANAKVVATVLHTNYGKGVANMYIGIGK